MSMGERMTKDEFTTKQEEIYRSYNQLIKIPNIELPSENNLYNRFKNPVLTAGHIPPEWRFDFDHHVNPFLLERLGINSIFNSGAIKIDGKYILVPRIEGFDRKSFFAVAESDTGFDNFKFWPYPISIPQTEDPDVNAYDMRLIRHQDGWIYGVFCTERKDTSAGPADTSAANAQAGIVRTKDLIEWERLPDLKTHSPQQRNVVLHPEFIEGKYAFYTRPQDGFIEAGSGGGIGWGLVKDITSPVIDREIIVDDRIYHTVKESKNGLGPAPIKTEQGWLQLAHGVRGTAAGLRYVLYVFMTSLEEPWRVTHCPGDYFMAPQDEERVGDVSNVLFSNGWIIDDNSDIYIYYASSDTRLHVARSSLQKMLDYVMHTPQDQLFSHKCVEQRIELINKNHKSLHNK